MKTGGRLIKHARYSLLLLAESFCTGACWSDVSTQHSLCPVQEKGTMRKSEVQVGNSGLWAWSLGADDTGPPFTRSLPETFDIE